MNRFLPKLQNSTNKLLTFILLAFIGQSAVAQFNTATVNGTIAASEYGTHTDGNNQQTSSGTVTYMTWDATNLYIGVSAANTAEGFVIYFDKDNLTPVDSGTNTNGTNIGNAYDGTNFAQLPFRADIVMYVKNGYREFRTATGSNTWSAATTAFGSYADNGSTVREFSIPWSSFPGAAKPAAFNWFSYVTSSGGFVYGQLPTANTTGAIGTTARYERYYNLTNTATSTATKPMSRDCFVFNNTADENTFGAISVYDFTMNTTGRQIARTTGTWTIGGTLRVNAGSLYYGSGGSYGASTVAAGVVSGGLLDIDLNNQTQAFTNSLTFSGGTFNMGNSGNAVTVAAGITSAATALPISGGTATISNGTLSIGASGGGSQALVLSSGTLTLSGGTINLNGNFSKTGGTLTQSGGTLSIDGNSGTAGTSVASGTAHFAITNNTGTACTAGTIRIVDPPHSSYSTSSTESVRINLSTAPTAYFFSGTHTFEFGNGVSTTGGNADGFNIDTYYGSINTRVPLNNVLVNSGSTTNRWVTTSFSSADGTNIQGNLTINTGCELRNTSVTSIFSVNGNISNAGTLTSTQTITFGSAPSTGGAVTTATVAQTVSGAGTFRNLTSSPTAKFTNLTFDNNATPAAVTFSIGDVTASGLSTFTNGIVDIGNNNNFNFTGTASTSARTTGYVIIQGTGQMKKDFATGNSAAFTYYVGENTGTTEYTPFLMDFSASSVTRTIGVKPVDAIHPNIDDVDIQTDYISRYWQLTNSAAGTYTYGASATYQASGDIVGTQTNMKPNLWGGATPWVQAAGTAAANVLTITAGATEANAPIGATTDLTGRVRGASVYTWNQTGTAAFGTAANWTPTRATPSADDILIFNGTTTPTPIVTGVTTQTIGKLLLTNSTNVNLQSSVAATLTISGGTGTDLDIPSGSTLNFSGSSTIGIAFSGAQTASVAGTLTYSSTAGTPVFDTTNAVMTVTGTINLSSLTNAVAVTSTNTTLLMNAASTMNITTLQTVIPLATWNTTSSINFTGTGTSFTNTAQSFGNFTYNSSSPTATLSFFTTSTATIKGDFNIAATGSGAGKLRCLTSGNLTVNGNINISNASVVDLMNAGAILAVTGSINMINTSVTNFANGAGTITVGGNVTVGDTAVVNFGNAAGANTTTITGNLNLNSSGTSFLALTSGSTQVINVAGNFTQTAGTFTLGSGTGAGSLKVAGSFTATGLSQTGSAASTIEFNGTSSQAITPGASVTGLINFRVSNSSGIAVTGTLPLNAGATFTASAAGTAVTSGMVAYSTTTTLAYVTAAGTQTTGSEFPATSGPVNLTINNTNATPNVTLSGSRGITGVLTLTAGRIILGSNDLTLGAASTVSGTPSATKMIVTDGSGQLKKVFATGTSTFTFPVGETTGTTEYSPNTLTFSANDTQRTIGVKVIDATHPNINTGNTPVDYLSRYWSFTDDQAGTYTYTGAFTYLTGGVDVNGAEANIKASQWNGTAWTQHTSTLASPVLTISAALNETTGLLNGNDFTGRTSPAITYTWNGTTNDWNTASNWLPTSVPTSSDDVVIDGTSAVLCSINSGTFAVNSFTLNGTGTFAMATGTTLSINGTLTYGGSATATFDCTSTLNISSSASQTIPALAYGSLNLTGGARVLANSGTIGICGAFTSGAGAFTTTGSTVDFNSSGSQTIPAFNFNNLTSSSSGARTLAGGVVGVAGIFTPGTNSYTITGNTINFGSAGSQTIPAFNYNTITNTGNGARTLASSGVVGIAGGFTAGSGAYTVTGSTVDFNGTAGITFGTFTYNNLTISSNKGGGTVSFGAGAITIGGALSYTATNASQAAGTGSVLFNSASSQTIPALNYFNLNLTGGARALASTGTISIAGTTFTAGSGPYAVTGSTVNFNGSTGLAIPALAPAATNNYNNMTISGSGSYALAASTTLAGNFTQSNGTFTVTPGASAFAMNVGGNFNQSAGIFYVTGTAATTGATVNVTGSTSVFSMFMEGNSSNTASTVLFQANGDATFTGSSTTDSLDWMEGGSGGTVYNITFGIKGNFNWTNATGKPWTSGSGTAKGFTFNGTGTTLAPQTITYSGATSDYGHIFAVNSGTVVKLLTGIAIGPNNNPYNTFTVNGTLDTNGFIVSGGNATVNAINTGFTLSSGATLITQSATGVQGSITTAVKNFSSAANYEFQGAATGVFTTAPTAFTVNNMVVNRSAGITLSQNMTAAGNLDFQSGLLNLSSFTMTIGAAGDVINATASKYVNGKLNRVFSATGTKAFPIGKSGVYRPLSFEYTSLTGTSTVSAEQFETALTGILPAGTNLNNSRYWDVSQSGGTGVAYKVTLDGTGDTVTGTVVMLKKESGTITSNPSTTPNYTNTSAYSGMTGTVSHALGSGCAVTAVAGPDQLSAATCGQTSVTLAADTPLYGTGLWTVAVGAGGSFGTALSPTSTFTGTPGVAYTLQWTITNGNCTSNDQVAVTLHENPTTAANTSIQTICTTGSATLSGNTALVGAGAWSVTSGPSNNLSQFSSVSNPTAIFTPDGGAGSYVVRWTISNSPCTDTTADAAITVDPASTGGTVSSDQSICSDSQPANLVLSGNIGSVIKWQSAADAAFTSPTDITITSTTLTGATIGNLAITTYFRAVVQNGVCATANSAYVTITIGSTTWNGSAWSNLAPTSTTSAIIAGNYNSSLNGGSITACTLTVNSGTVFISTGDDVTLNGALTVVSGSFTLDNNANLLQTTNAANSGNIIVKRNSSLILRQDYTLWSSPVADQDIFAFSPLTVVTPTSRFYTYNTSTNFYESIVTPSGVDFATAKGYLIRVRNTHSAITPSSWTGVFTGEPHNGTINYTMDNFGMVGLVSYKYNLIGNPYPSPIDAIKFVDDNAATITGTLYFWRKTNNAAMPSYSSWSKAGYDPDAPIPVRGTFVTSYPELTDPEGIIQTGQGFFVEALGAATNVEFNNDQRVGNHADQFFRNAAITAVPSSYESHRIWLNVANVEGAFCQTAIGYFTGATLGFDYGIDGKAINDGPIELYSTADTNKLVIQGRPVPFDATDVVPLGFKATVAGNYSIAIDHLDGLFSGSQDIYLKDNLTGAEHDLKAGAYNFTSDAGTFETRFEIIYQNALGVNDPVLENAVVIYKQGDHFVITSGSTIMDNVKVFDIRGRLLVDKTNINASETTVNAGETNQVLIVKITSDTNQSVTKKVVN